MLPGGKSASLLARLRLRSAPKPVVRIPILTYHSAHSKDITYATNDHVALEEDLRLIRQLDFRLVSIVDVVDWLAGVSNDTIEGGNAVAITFDDAPDWDYFDYIHRDIGCVKSFYRILVEYAEETGAKFLPERPLAVSFAIADPEVRALLDRVGMAGRGHWRDSWWAEMAATGVIGIANHSWDHTHAVVPIIRQRDQRKGTFMGIDNEGDANAQIAQSQRFIWYRTAGLALPYFAYPYGDAPDYLVQDYLPRRMERHGLRAAFGTQGEHVVRGQNVWHIPRYVFREHWHTQEDLAAILRGAVHAGH